MKHFKWIKKVRKICQELNPDVVHFVWGDSFYRFFGLGFSWVKKYKSIITFHQVRKSKLHILSIKLYGKLFDHLVVHTKRLYEEIICDKVPNVYHIEYPNFRNAAKIDKSKARSNLNISTYGSVLLCLGGTRNDKGLDLLLQALDTVDKPFYLLIAGEEQEIKRNEIEELTYKYRERVKVILKYLSYREIDWCLSASDYIILPYRFSFDGASGPLAEGVGYGKCIIGPSHGSLGEIITSNHIGYTFTTENINSLSETINLALTKSFKYDQIANKYRESLKTKYFQNEYKKLYLGG